MSYAESLKKYYNAVDGTFYDAINRQSPIANQQSTIQTILTISNPKVK